MILFDIETDGLIDEVTKIYCMSYTTDGETIETITRLPDMVSLIGDSSFVVGHNIGTYDLPVMEKLGQLDFKGLIIDTLWLSWYLYPSRNKHGLEDWGEELGFPKVKVEKEGWKEGNMDLMIKRCERDVLINWKLWKKQHKMLEELYT
jgi:DNA polymerase III alpha subunit (gram-positive type)